MRVLVTGGGGFVGFQIAKMLRERGEHVRTIARGDYTKLTEIGAEHLRGDLSEKEAARAAVAGVDAVIHVAAKAGVWGAPVDYERSNVVGTQNLIDACIEGGVGRLVFTSSPSVTFDGGDAANVDETIPYPKKHLYHYGRTKAEAERRVLRANATPHKRGPTVLLTCALRPHLVYGPGDPHILPRMIARAKAGRLAWVGSGNLMDVTFVENAAHAHVLALDALSGDKARPAGKSYFISQGKPVEPSRWVNRFLREVGLPEVSRRVPLAAAYAIGALCEAAWTWLPLRGEPLMTRYIAAQLGTSHYYNLTAARRDLGYEPVVSDEIAFARTATWLKDELAAGRI